jgi:hypothetical protein
MNYPTLNLCKTRLYSYQPAHVNVYYLISAISNTALTNCKIRETFSIIAWHLVISETKIALHNYTIYMSIPAFVNMYYLIPHINMDMREKLIGPSVNIKYLYKKSIMYFMQINPSSRVKIVKMTILHTSELMNRLIRNKIAFLR